MQRITKPTASAAALQTTAPITPGVEWLRPADVKPFCGIGRSTLYSLIESGAVKSVVLRREGKAKGCRLVSVSSLRALLNGMEAK